MTSSDFRADRVGAALAGTNPTVLRRIDAGFAVIADAFLHAHVTPRYEWEPDDIVGWPAALHHWTGRVSDDHQLGPQHDALRAELVAEIDEELDLRRGRSSR